MAGWRTTLIALRLPGNIERELTLLRTRLFRETGNASFAVLPPVVPVRWLHELPELPRAVQGGRPELHIAGYTWHGGSLFARLTESWMWNELAATLPRPSVTAPAPFDEFPGVYLGTLAQRSEDEAGVPDTPFEELVTRSVTLTAIRIEARTAEKWPRALLWRIESEVRLKHK